MLLAGRLALWNGDLGNLGLHSIHSTKRRICLLPKLKWTGKQGRRNPEETPLPFPLGFRAAALGKPRGWAVWGLKAMTASRDAPPAPDLRSHGQQTCSVGGTMEGILNRPSSNSNQCHPCLFPREPVFIPRAPELVSVRAWSCSHLSVRCFSVLQVPAEDFVWQTPRAADLVAVYQIKRKSKWADISVSCSSTAGWCCLIREQNFPGFCARAITSVDLSPNFFFFPLLFIFPEWQTKM